MARGTLEVIGRLVASTHNALLCTATLPCPGDEPDLVAACVYKPTAGERPLDDFPDGTLSQTGAAARRRTTPSPRPPAAGGAGAASSSGAGLSARRAPTPG